VPLLDKVQGAKQNFKEIAVPNESTSKPELIDYKKRSIKKEIYSS